MINEVFSNIEFLKNYFETYIKSNKRFPQSIIFEGQDTFLSYFFALELARILNCTENKAPNCECTSCKWIKSGSHPSVINITPIDNKPSNDKSQSVISVKQINDVISSINDTTDTHKFFIFSDAKICKYDNITEASYNTYIKAGYSIPREDWQPLPVTRKIMQDESANALLKSVEEAPDKRTFIFLTTTRDNIVSTIVSRSLIFKTSALPIISNIPVAEYFKGYPTFSIEEGLQRAAEITSKISKEEIDTIQILNSMQNYLLEMLKLNIDNISLVKTIEKDIKRIELAKKHHYATIMPKNLFEGLFIDISAEGRKLL